MNRLAPNTDTDTDTDTDKERSMHTLLATTGASPQIITETLYAIHHENRQWPDEIFLITTSFGKEKAVEGLIRQKHLQRLLQKETEWLR